MPNIIIFSTLLCVEVHLVCSVTAVSLKKQQQTAYMRKLMWTKRRKCECGIQMLKFWSNILWKLNENFCAHFVWCAAEKVALKSKFTMMRVGRRCRYRFPLLLFYVCVCMVVQFWILLVLSVLIFTFSSIFLCANCLAKDLIFASWFVLPIFLLFLFFHSQAHNHCGNYRI